MSVCNMTALSVLAYANGFTLWHYKLSKSDNFSDVMDPNFFITGKDLIERGDMIIVTGGGFGHAKILVACSSDDDYIVTAPI